MKRERTRTAWVRNEIHRATGWRFKTVDRVLGLWNEALYFILVGAFALAARGALGETETVNLFGFAVIMFLHRVLLKDKM